MKSKSTEPKMQGREELQKHFVEELKDLYNAENQLVKALPKMAKAAASEELRAAFEEHLEVTEEQINRLKKIFEELDERPTGVKCKGMEGLVAEGEEKIKEGKKEEGAMKDISLIAAAQKVEHYEISGYGTARTLAENLGMDEAAELLQQTLDEEGEADKKLTEISEGILQEAGNESLSVGQEESE